MKLARTIAMTLGLTFSIGGALTSTALADEGRERQQRHDDQRNDDDDDGVRDSTARWDNNGRGDDTARWDNNGRGEDTARWERDDDGRWDRDDRRDHRHWGHFVPVRVVNERDQWVTLFLNGRYVGRVAPNSRQRIAVPAGYHTLTYRVGHRNNVRQVSLSAIPGQRNRVVIEGRRGGWGRW